MNDAAREGRGAFSTKRRDDIQDAAKAPVFSVMSHGVRTVRPDLSLEGLVTLFAQEGLSRVLVVDDKNNAVGVVSKSDVVVQRYLEGDTRTLQAPVKRGVTEPLTGGFHESRDLDDGVTVAELMTPRVVKISDEVSVAAACAVMTENGLHGVAVFSNEGLPVGWLSATDVVRWVATHST